MQTSTKVGLAAIVVLILLLCGAWALILSGNFPTLISLAPTPTFTPAPTNTPSSTPTAIGTPTPTATPENTPTPTATPEDTPTPVPPFPTPQPGGAVPERPLRIAYMDASSGDWEIMIAEADGANPQNLSNDPGLDAFPIWSPQNELIAFGSDRYGPGLELLMTTVDGLPPINLSQAPETDDFGAKWSPNGQLVAFNSNRFGDLEVFVATPEDTLYNLSFHEADDLFFGWHPECATIASADGWDKCRILIGSDRGNETQELTLYTISADGENFNFAIDRDLTAIEAAYSPDGAMLAYVKVDPETDQPDLYIYSFETEEETRLTDDLDQESSIAWSPNGDVIAYIITIDEANDIYTITIPDGEITNLTDTPAPVSEALNNDFEWSPDGTQILFSTNRDGNAEIYTMNADGSDPINITNSAGPEIEAIWLR